MNGREVKMILNDKEGNIKVKYFNIRLITNQEKIMDTQPD
jgi:hypothetical protein